MDNVTWKDIHISDFVEAAVHIVCNELFHTVQTLQEKLKCITDIVHSWSYGIMDIFLENKLTQPLKIEVLDQKQRYGCPVFFLVEEAMDSVKEYIKRPKAFHHGLMGSYVYLMSPCT